MMTLFFVTACVIHILDLVHYIPAIASGEYIYPDVPLINLVGNLSCDDQRNQEIRELSKLRLATYKLRRDSGVPVW